MNRTHNRRPSVKRPVFSFGDDEQDDDTIINSVEPLPSQAIERTAFTAHDFNLDRFLSSRRHLGLESLKIELNSHLKLLKTELIELLNRDYQDFVNLSTNLKGVDRAMEDLMKPLTHMETQVKVASVYFQHVMASLEEQLAQRAHVREKKAHLKLILNIHESVTKVEDLLEINTDTTKKKDANVTPAVVDVEGKDISAENSLGKHIERVAIEFNQMLHLVGRGKDLAFVSENTWRITRIKDTLQSKLSSAFSSALCQLEKNSTDKAAKQNLVQCLRTYVLIDQVQVAESLICQELVRPFVSKVITKKAVEMPRTKGNQPTPLLPLTAIYGKIISFIMHDLHSIMEITQKTLKGANYEVLVNSIWVEVIEHIHRECSVIYASGQTDVFHRNYLATTHFISSIEALCACKKSLLYLRNHPSYVEFMKRWQLAVYFQLRFREIVNPVEELLSDQQKSISLQSLEMEEGIALPGTKAVFKAIQQCWSDKIFLYGLSHRFWKLTLQLLRRYISWASEFVESVQEYAPTSPEKEKTHFYPGMNTPRLGLNANNSSDTDITEEAVKLKQLALLEHDIEILVSKITNLLEEVILPKLPTTMPCSLLQGNINDILHELDNATLVNIHNRITGIMSRRCMDTIRLIPGITSQYRHTNKAPPTEPSYFVPTLFRPYTVFIDQTTEWADPSKHSLWGQTVGKAVLTRYMDVMTEMLTNLQKTEASLKKLKKSKKMEKAHKVGNLLTDAAMTDEDKIRLQLLLDVRQVGKELLSLGIDKEQFEPYTCLYQVVKPFESIGSNEVHS